jgi:hypothetical protein
MGLRAAIGAVGAAMLGATCAVTMCAGCAAPASTASHSAHQAQVTHLVTPAHIAVATGRPRHFCAYRIDTPTAAEQVAINRYWTPLARSALTMASQGKMWVSVPKRHLSPAQHQALRRAEWAERIFSPKPRLACAHLPSGRAPHRASMTPSQ